MQDLEMGVLIDIKQLENAEQQLLISTNWLSWQTHEQMTGVMLLLLGCSCYQRTLGKHLQR